MDLVRLMYRYINKFINSKQLLEELNNLDLSNYSEEEKEQIKKLIKDIEIIIDDVPNEFDDYEKHRQIKIDKFLDSLNKIQNSNTCSEESKDLFNKEIKSLKREKTLERDGGKLYDDIFYLMTRNELVCQYAESMNDKELLEFIAQYIYVPFPPHLEQEEFDNLVQAGIEGDKREWLWRLAVNYNYKSFDFSKIVDYFIQVRDGYYIQELLSACCESVDIFEVAKKVIKTGNREFMIEVQNRCLKLELINESDRQKIMKDNGIESD